MTMQQSGAGLCWCGEANHWFAFGKPLAVITPFKGLIKLTNLLFMFNIRLANLANLVLH